VPCPIRADSWPLPPVESIARSLLILCGQRVILDRDLAAIYGVSTGRFNAGVNEAVKRNAKRFPEDFMFQLTREEAERSRSQTATLNRGRGYNIKYLPHAFTEHGGHPGCQLAQQRPSCRDGNDSTASINEDFPAALEDCTTTASGRSSLRETAAK
jgi:hypothetical protein